MKNITVSVPDDVYRRARVQTAKGGISVSALVGDDDQDYGGLRSENPVPHLRMTRDHRPSNTGSPNCPPGAVSLPGSGTSAPPEGR